MTRTAGVTVDNQFIRGLVTEATGLNFPEDAATETYDCVFNKNGTVSRRLGFAPEVGYSIETATRSSSFMTSFIWRSVSGQRELSFVVQQFGASLYFYRVSTTNALSTQKQTYVTDLTDYQILGSPDVNEYPCSFTTISGVLVVTHQYCQPFYVAYDVAGNSFSDSSIDILIRDFEGVDDSLTVDGRPSTLSDAHEYNLYNQGWYADAVKDGGSTAGVLATWDAARTDYPSNADVWWLFKDADDEFNTAWIDKYARGNTPAPKGHYLLDPFDTDRSGADSDIGTVDESSSGYYRPRICAAYSSRVFYAGVDSLGYSNKIYFTQTLDNLSKIGLCYQANDPTSEDLFDLLPTDGGVIVIPEIGNIINLVPFTNYLLVFASNGIWAIQGSQGIGFAANDYSVSKISTVSALSTLSFVLVDGVPIWWNTDGIYAIAPSQNSGLEVQSLTDDVIKTFFKEIPDSEKIYVKGAYNSLEKRIQWLYKSSASTTIDGRFDYDRVLNFNTETRSFFPWTISNSDSKINDLVAVKGLGSSGQTLSSSFFYLTSEDNGSDFNIYFTVSRDDGYTDFSDVDYTSYVITGYRIRGNAMMKFQANYINTYLLRESAGNGSCKIQGLWDFSTTADSNRWTNQQELYLDNDTKGTLIRRVKLRGSGKILQLKFSSSSGKPFNLIGWSMFVTGNQSV